uniref:Secreted protein n=1 Tax=Arundo donax TaxID=35708 RepID=A0A0A9EIR1_ARUDO
MRGQPSGVGSLSARIYMGSLVVTLFASSRAAVMPPTDSTALHQCPRHIAMVFPIAASSLTSIQSPSTFSANRSHVSSSSTLGQTCLLILVYFVLNRSIRSCRTGRLGSDTVHGAAQLVDQ